MGFEYLWTNLSGTVNFFKFLKAIAKDFDELQKFNIMPEKNICSRRKLL